MNWLFKWAGQNDSEDNDDEEELYETLTLQKARIDVYNAVLENQARDARAAGDEKLALCLLARQKDTRRLNARIDALSIKTN